MNKNESQKHKKRDGGKWIITGVAFFIIIIMLVGLCLQVWATSEKVKPSNWFKKDEETEQLPDEGGENAAFVQGTREHGVRLMSSVVTYAGAPYQSGYTLTATVLPEDADNKLGDWTYAWENPASAWATGKNVKDYFSVTFTRSTGWVEDENMPGGGYEGTETKDVSESDGTHLEVRASVKMAYGEPIVVKFTSRDDQTKYATKTFGYVKRVNEGSMNIVLKKGGAATDTLVLGDDQTYTVEFTYTLSDGTVAPDITVQTTFGFESWVMDYGDGLVDNYGKEYSIANNSFVSTADFYKNCFTNTVTVREIKNHVAKFGSNAAAHLYVSVTISSDVTTNLYKTSLSKRRDIKVDASLLQIPVSSVSIEGDEEVYF